MTTQPIRVANEPKVIAADLPMASTEWLCEALLNAFKVVAEERQDVKLVLASRRDPEAVYSVWNEVDRSGLVGRVEFFPYYEHCDRFPVKKCDCDVWISRGSSPEDLTATDLMRRLSGEVVVVRKYALFFTSFHPLKQEGNSKLMRIWLEHLKKAGYQVHVVYYMYDRRDVSSEMRRQAFYEYDLYLEVDVVSKMTGSNQCGLNVHVDDWCGGEALNAVARLTSWFEYDIAITNYPFMTAIFQRVAAYTKKILLTHDSFTDRNRRMSEQGYGDVGWASIDEQGERLACERSDVIIALQEEEAKHFRRLADDSGKVVVISPMMTKREVLPRCSKGRLRIGYFGSSNWVNEQNIGEYIKFWLEDRSLVAGSEIVVGGGVCDTLAVIVPSSILTAAEPKLLGRFDDPWDFFSQCDLVVNPERGGTGIKIKTLEALAHGMPVLTTVAGSVGIGSTNRFHLAKDISELAGLTAKVVSNRALLSELREATATVFNAYANEQRGKLDTLLGPAVRFLPREHGKVAGGQMKEIIVPTYVKETAASYQVEEFRKFIERVDIEGKRILEIGSDFHLVSARLFRANGAREVIATNIGDWRSEEPLPDGVEFKVCDVADLGSAAEAFDIVYGIAVLEHIPDLERVCVAITNLLQPEGVAYLQGWPLWLGPVGHHVYYRADASTEAENGLGAADPSVGEPILYRFDDPLKNPIPDWAHLSLAPDDLTAVLTENGVPAAHASGIARSIYNLDGDLTGCCSNFLSSGEILDVIGRHFSIAAERILSDADENEHYLKARMRYPEEELRTQGLKIWLRNGGRALTGSARGADCKVSIIIPFYNVEPYISECLSSVVAQDYSNLEIVLIDDASPDGSRRVVERFAESDPRIRLLTHDVNLGLGPARNTGVEHGTGDYLLFLDSDDLFASTSAVSQLVAHAEASGCKVVVGSCQRLATGGHVEEFDRAFDRRYGGRPGEIVEGEAAYLGASFLPGGQYVPMRAWGALIHRDLFREAGLSFPASEHEDLSHTPFLYYVAGRVLYVPDIIITYRERSNSLSRAPWDADQSLRYAAMWRQTKATLERLQLRRHLGNTALKTVEHMLMRLVNNGLEGGAEAAVIEAVAEILADAKGDLSEELLFYTLDRMRAVLNFGPGDFDLHRRLTSAIDIRLLSSYYRSRLGGSLVDYGSIPILAVAADQR
jgi:glycosyltransferase involved in cell wall biosynthesis/SAM-dependent methyltransferase